MGKARKELPPLRRGGLEWLRCGGRVVSFARELAGERIIAAVNAGDRAAVIELPQGNHIRLEPMTGGLFRENGAPIFPLPA